MAQKLPNEAPPAWPTEQDMQGSVEDFEQASHHVKIPLPITPHKVHLKDTKISYELSITVGGPLESRLADLGRHPQLQPVVAELERLATSQGISGVGYLQNWEFRARLAEAELTALYLDAKELPARERRATAAKGARARLKNNPTHQAKAEALALWKDWQSGRVVYKNGSAFHRVVGEKLGVSTKTMERWCMEWRKIPG